MRTWNRAQRVRVLAYSVALLSVGGTLPAGVDGEASTPVPPALTQAVSSTPAPPRLVFASDTGFVVDLAQRYAALFAECVALWPEQIDQQAPLGATLPEPVAQHLRDRVAEREGDSYQVLKFGATASVDARLSGFTYHSQGAHAGLDGFMGLLSVPGWTPEVTPGGLRPVGLAWRTSTAVQFVARNSPALQASERARSKTALEAAFPGWDIPDAEMQALERKEDGSIGVAAVLHGRATKDVLLSVTMLQDDEAYVVPIDTLTSSVLCFNRFAFYLHEANPEHCAPVLNGTFYLFPATSRGADPALVIVSDAASSLLEFRSDSTSSKAIPGYVLTEVTGFSYGF